MQGSPQPLGTLKVALGQAARLLETAPAAAVEQAREILKVVPGEPAATLVLGTAHRACGDLAEALTVLEELVAAHPKWAGAHFELGVTCSRAERSEQAIAALRKAVELKPDHADAWRELADQLYSLGDDWAADTARAQSIKASTRDPDLLEAGAALVDGRIAVAERILRAHLLKSPTDVAAIRMLAEVGARLGRYADSETLLARCLELAPGFMPARANYAFVLNRQGKAGPALKEVELLLAADPENPGYRNLKATILSRVGDTDEAIELYGGVLAQFPKHAKVWMSYGHALKTAGRQADSIAAYRKSIERSPNLGEAWWSLANLKTFRFTPADLDAMRAQLSRPDLNSADRFHFDFAIAKALEDAGEYAESFEHYARANALRRKFIKYEASDTTERVQREKALFTPQFFAERAGFGCTAPDPIFIVGLPRAGSTLLEQILSSHPLVEGTQELPDIVSMSRKLGSRTSPADPSKYPEVLATLDAQQLRALGEQYLEQTRIQRKTKAPYFIDKLPNNWLHVGMIHLILPNARIIDARRHPLGCCLSGFKQHFAQGQHFTYDLADIGRYYHDYVDLMAHMDEVLPGRVHRVHYESTVGNLEAEVRRLLAACGLNFHENCLFFYRTERAVRTASSEQVRRPIFKDAVEHWQRFDPWLGPLREALGPVLDAYPQVPLFQSTAR
jgi:tetratricopeptide (TPR) repeat protein